MPRTLGDLHQFRQQLGFGQTPRVTFLSICFLQLFQRRFDHTSQQGGTTVASHRAHADSWPLSVMSSRSLNSTAFSPLPKHVRTAHNRVTRVLLAFILIAAASVRFVRSSSVSRTVQHLSDDSGCCRVCDVSVVSSSKGTLTCRELASHTGSSGVHQGPTQEDRNNF